MTMIKEAVKRAKSPTPKFFKRLTVYGAYIFGLGTTLIGLQSQLPPETIVLPPDVAKIGGILVTIGITMMGLCKLPVNDNTKP